MEEAIKKEEHSQNLCSDQEPREEGARNGQDRVASIIPGGLQNQDLNIIAHCQEEKLEKQDTLLKRGKILDYKV